MMFFITIFVALIFNYKEYNKPFNLKYKKYEQLS